PSSYAYSVSGGEQVGVGGGLWNGSHAILWHGTSSYIDLHPAGLFSLSQGFGTDGEYQVGSARTYDGLDHAFLWHGNNQGVDLNPVGESNSVAFAVRDGIQVGQVGSSGAAVWHGTNDPIHLSQFMNANFGASQADAIDALGNIYGL